MKEFVGLRLKMCSYTGEESGKREKGVTKPCRRKTISHDDYRQCLLDQTVFHRNMTVCVLTRIASLVRASAKRPSRLSTPRNTSPQTACTPWVFGHKDIPSHDSENVAGELVNFLNTTALPHFEMNFD